MTETKDGVYTSPKTGTIYALTKCKTPAGELGWSDLNEPAPFYKEKDDPNAKKAFRAALLWYDPKTLDGQSRTKKFLKECEDFIALCKVDPDKVVLPIQLKEGEDEDGNPVKYKVLRSEAYADRPPALAKLDENGRAISVEKATEKVLNRGCQAAIKGRLRLSKFQGTYYLKVILDVIVQIREGQPPKAKASADDIDIGDVKEFGDAAKPVSADEEVDW